MLQFILGRAGSGKTEYLRRMLIERSKECDRLFLIVPEQYSFETEKAILHLAGPVNAAKINVLSFSRLAELVFREVGGTAGKKLDDGGRRILMNLAIKQTAEELEIYKNSAKSGRIADMMLHAVSEMKMCRITDEQLQTASTGLPEGALKAKLKDISNIYKEYNKLISSTYLDSQDDLSKLADILPQISFFESATVAVDSFEGFTAQETAVLREIIREAKEVNISLCTDGVHTGETSLFALVNRTKAAITKIAEEYKTEILPDILLSENRRHRNPSLAAIEKNIYEASGKVEEKPDGIHVYESEDIYEEAAYIASTIRNLVMEKGYKYGDFTVICRMPERYGGILDVELKKRSIACFISEPERIDTEPVMRFTLGAFEAIARSFSTDEIMKILKTGVSGFSSRDISDLENYALLWKLKGSAWRAEFTRHPRGFGYEQEAADTAELSRLNALRERIVKPLERFAAKTRGATGEKISEAVYEMLMDFGMEENIHAYCRKLEQSGELSLAAKQVRIWELLIGILEQLAEVLKDKPISREEYYTLMRDVILSEDISEIPQTLDEVIFGTPEQVRQSTPKVVFILGAVQGEFPLIPRNSGVFSDYERKLLINDFSLPLSDSLEQKTIEERYLSYSAVSLPSHELYVTYPKRVEAEDCEPSEIVSSVASIFHESVYDKKLSLTQRANSPEAAFSEMAALYRTNDTESESVKTVFENREEFFGRKEALKRAAASEEASIKDDKLAAEFFGDNPKLSASQIETYHSCRFRYFCQYGLRAREQRPAEVDVLQYGTIMHYLFEKIFSPDSAFGKAQNLTEDDLSGAVKSLIREYADASMGGYDNISGREKYRLDRMAESAVLLIRHVCEELAQSSFKPEFFELKLGENPSYPPLRITSANGEATVIGTIDRVDIYNSARGRFVRVIDYKTGSKKFDLLDVLYGLNMQMLVYLAALVASGKEFPAGILYMPSASPSVPAERNEAEAKIKAEAGKSLKMSGVVLEDAEIIKAMDSAASGKFISAKIKKDESITPKDSVLSEAELAYVLDYSKKLIASMVSELQKGEIEAEPYMINKNSCAFCPYGAVCGKEFSDKDKMSLKMNRDDILMGMGVPESMLNAGEGGDS